MTELSDEEKFEQAKFIQEEVVHLTKRFEARGMRVADLIWVMVTICDMFIRASDQTLLEQKIVESIRIRLAAMQRAGMGSTLVNRVFIDKTIQDLSGGGADFEELKSPFKA